MDDIELEELERLEDIFLGPDFWEKADRAYRDLQDPSLCHKDYDYSFA